MVIPPVKRFLPFLSQFLNISHHHKEEPMATTRKLNDAGTVWATTFFGGENKGTCIQITMKLDVQTQISRIFTLPELVETLNFDGDVSALNTPEFDN